MFGDLHRPGRASGPIQPRRSGDDAVEIGRVALRRLHRLPPAGRAAVEIRKLRIVAVIGRDHLLGCHRCFVHGAPSEVDKLLGMTEGEAGIVAGVAGVCGAHGISACQSRSHLAMVDVAVECAVSDGLIFAIPACCRQPELHVDLESEVGLSVAATRQCSGIDTPLPALGGASLTPVEAEDGSIFADVIVVVGSASDISPSHEPAADTRNSPRSLITNHTSTHTKLRRQRA